MVTAANGNELILMQELVDVAKRARENKLSLSEMAGGTFTISNGMKLTI